MYAGKLTPDQVLAIREDTRSDAKIALDYNVSRQAIYKVRYGYSHKTIGGSRQHRRRAKLTVVTAAQIRADMRPSLDVAVAYGISRETVRRVRRGAAWAGA